MLVLVASFCTVLLMSNWFALRLINVFGIYSTAGTLVFPLTFLLSDLITEVYGYDTTRKTIWLAFFFNLIFILYGQIIIHIPSPTHDQNLSHHFDTLMCFNVRVVFASLLSFLVSELSNSMLLSRIKVLFSGKHMGIRFIISTSLSSFLNGFLFSFFAFWRILPNNELLKLTVTICFAGIFIELLLLPISVKIAKILKTSEKIDVYDSNQNYRIFSLSG